MFYEPGITAHGLKYSPYKACVVPRPVGWISTLSADGVHNLAPFSQFQSLTFDPPYVMFSANQTTEGKRKDSCVNAEQTGEFVWNMATYDLRNAVNLSAEEFPPEVDEFAVAGLTKAAARYVRPAMVAESPVHFECRYYQTLRLPGNGTLGTVDVVIGRVIGVHISDDAGWGPSFFQIAVASLGVAAPVIESLTPEPPTSGNGNFPTVMATVAWRCPFRARLLLDRRCG